MVSTGNQANPSNGEETKASQTKSSGPSKQLTGTGTQKKVEPYMTNVQKNKFGFRTIGTKPNPNRPPANGRGPTDPTYVCELMYASWDELTASFKDLEEGEAEALKDYFNTVCPQQELGEYLFRTKEEFKTKTNALGDQNRKLFTNAVIEVGLLEKV